MEFLVGLALALIAGVVPMLLYALALWWFDRYEAEPAALITAVFLWGAVPSIVLALILEIVFDVPIRTWLSPGSLTYELVGGGIIAPVVEELLKGLAILGVYLFFYREFDGVLDGIIYGSLVGFGFAAVENVMYFLSALSAGGLGEMVTLVLLRAFVFGLNHAFFTSLTGIGFALGRLSRAWPAKLGAPLAGLGLAIGAHAVHNGGVMLAEVSCLWPLFSLTSDWLGVSVVLMIIFLATTQERRWLRQYLPEEVSLGVLSAAEYSTVCSSMARTRARAQALFCGDLGRWWRLGQFYQAATELAFKKHQLITLGDERGAGVVIEKLRRQLFSMPR